MAYFLKKHNVVRQAETKAEAEKLISNGFNAVSGASGNKLITTEKSDAKTKKDADKSDADKN